MSNSDIKDDKSMSSGGKEGTDHKTGAERQSGAGGQPAGQRQQSTGQPDTSGGQQGGQNPNRSTQQGGSGSGKSSDDMQSKDPGNKGKS
jgi:hypothetical protein